MHPGWHLLDSGHPVGWVECKSPDRLGMSIARIGRQGRLGPRIGVLAALFQPAAAGKSQSRHMGSGYHASPVSATVAASSTHPVTHLPIPASLGLLVGSNKVGSPNTQSNLQRLEIDLWLRTDECPDIHNSGGPI